MRALVAAWRWPCAGLAGSWFGEAVTCEASEPSREPRPPPRSSARSHWPPEAERQHAHAHAHVRCVRMSLTGPFADATDRQRPAAQGSHTSVCAAFSTRFHEAALWRHVAARSCWRVCRARRRARRCERRVDGSARSAHDTWTWTWMGALRRVHLRALMPTRRVARGREAAGSR